MTHEEARRELAVCRVKGRIDAHEARLVHEINTLRNISGL